MNEESRLGTSQFVTQQFFAAEAWSLGLFHKYHVKSPKYPSWNSKSPKYGINISKKLLILIFILVYKLNYLITSDSYTAML